MHYAAGNSFRSIIAVIVAAGTMFGCGGGGSSDSSPAQTASSSSVVLSPSVINNTFPEGKQGFVRLTATVLKPEDFAGASTVYAVLVDSTGVLAPQVSLDQATPSRYYVGLTTSNTAMAGTYQGTFNVQLCRDKSCATQFPGSPIKLPYNITISPAIKEPMGIAVDASGNAIFVDSGRVRKLALDGTLTDLAGHMIKRGKADGTGRDAQFAILSGITAAPDGSFYVGDEHRIRKVTAQGVVTTVAGGTANLRGLDDGPVATATFSYPTAFAFDRAGNLFVADTSNSAIRKITPAGVVSTFLRSIDCFSGAISTQSIRSLVIDRADNLYFAQQCGGTPIIRVDPNGKASVFAGSTTSGLEPKDGPFGSNRFRLTAGLAIDANDNLYAGTDATLRKISPKGDVTTIAGSSGLRGDVDGDGSAARFVAPNHIAVSGTGDIFVADLSGRIRKITPAGKVTTLLAKP